MAPPRSKPQPDDSRSEASSTKEKAGTNSNAVNGKARRAGGTAGTGSSLRDVVSAGQNSTAVAGTAGAETTPSTSVGGCHPSQGFSN